MMVLLLYGWHPAVSGWLFGFLFMIAKGKNASELFPAVVKNVASKNIEVFLQLIKNIQPDLARDVSVHCKGDPNQLIRASALRVLSSIRVPIIVPIMMLAIKEASSDLSPYVRKNAAHAIQKLYSVVMAFEEVCPDRIDLIHKNYRKLCNLLVDVEEWGQVVIIHMLTRYARTQFVSPWKTVNLGSPGQEEHRAVGVGPKEGHEDDQKTYTMDPDHRLLLRNTKPLLQSRNAAGSAVYCSAKYCHYVNSEKGKPCLEFVKLHYIELRQTFYVCSIFQGMFEPYLKSFYVRSTDPTMIKTLKLEIMTNLANEANISTLLREFQTYVKSQDKQFAAATIQAIGRCATNITEVTDTCLNGLVCLLSNRDEIVVAESVVVIKKLLQTQPAHHGEIIKHMAKLLDNITVPVARASILWLIGEYCERVPKIAPDVLRKTAKSFTNEDDLVKLQILNLGAKLYLTNSKQVRLKYTREYVYSHSSFFVPSVYESGSESEKEHKEESSGDESSGNSSSTGVSSDSESEESTVTTQVFVPTKTHEMLHRMTGKGLSANYQFSRQPCIFGDHMVSVQVTLTNTTDQKIDNIHIGEKKLPPGMRMHEFNPIECLEPERSVTVSMGIDFCDSTQTASFQLCTKDDHFNVNIQPPVGELLLPVTMSEKDFKKEQGEKYYVAPQNSTSRVIIERLMKAANLGVVPSGQDRIHRFAAKTVHSGSLMLVTMELKESSTAQLIINTEKTVIGSVLLRELKPVLSQG
uniref:Adaptor related protein complex 3 subunit beta 1 n=1 Tax=Pavo cristatus TaxID=9049 RepID=A0A8C9G659_PAVCR